MASKLVIIDNKLVDGGGCKDKILTIPNNVTQIGDGAFINNTYIEKVIINSECKKIGARAFGRCSNLKEVGFEDGSKLKTIGEEAFFGCHLKKIDIPDKVEILDSISLNAEEIKLPKGIRKITKLSFGLDPFVFLPDTIELLEPYFGIHYFFLHKKEAPKTDHHFSWMILTGVISNHIQEYKEFKYVVFEDEDGQNAIALFYDENNKVIVVPESIDGVAVRRVYNYNSNEKTRRIVHRLFLPESVDTIFGDGYYYVKSKLNGTKNSGLENHNWLGEIDIDNLIINDIGVFEKKNNSVNLVCCTSDERIINVPEEIDGLKLNKVLKNAFVFYQDYKIRFVSFPENIVIDDGALNNDYLIYNIGEKTFTKTSNMDHIISHPLYTIKVVGIASDTNGIFEFLLVEKDGNKEAIIINSNIGYGCKALPSIPKTIQGYKVTMASIPFGRFFAADNNSIKKEDVIAYFEQSGLDLI